MQLCLSARMFTVSGTRDQFELEPEAFVQFAKKVGYDGITLRPGQLDERTSGEQVDRLAEALEQNNAVCSFAMGGTAADETGYRAMCKLVDDGIRLGCRHIQPSVRNEAEISWMQKVCDYAAERDVRVCPQLHDSTLHDTVPNCLTLFKKIGRENFGLNFEASHLILQQAEVKGAEAIRVLGEKIFTVCVQNYKREDGKPVAVLPGDPLGVDFEEVFGALGEIGFDGFVTHMSGAYPGLENEAVCRAYVTALKPFMGR
ncbi:MAG: sugar phosphate isomerase/epimerase [bacterium]|nr:sugar phosphate isomerase/epimerase [bacterium]